MAPVLTLHVAAGGLALASGYAALFAAKGGRLHRRSGVLFVVAMLAMASAALAVAIGDAVAPAINVPAALLTIYLVASALFTVRAPPTGATGVHRAIFAGALVTSATALALGFAAMARGEFAILQLVFGAVAAAGAVGDFRVLRRGPPRGGRRLARHLWRMCVALLIAALSFFVGQADVLPAQLRIYPLLAAPLVVVLGALAYWLRRLRSKPALGPPEAA